METFLKQMIDKYQIDNIGDKRNAIKEVTQEIVLCGLSRDIMLIVLMKKRINENYN